MSWLQAAGGERTAYRDTVPIRKPEHSGLRAFWGRGRPAGRVVRTALPRGHSSILVGELRYHRLHGAAKKKRRGF